MRIGIFDSGIGGLSVLHYVLKVIKNKEVLYYADEQHVPYGEKSSEEIIQYVDEIVKFMIEHNCKIIVIACNTATSVAVNFVREKYSIPIIGMEPAIKKAIDLNTNKRVLVVATPVTVNGKKMFNLVRNFDKNKLVDLLPLPMLVNFAENGSFNSANVVKYLEKELSKFDLNEYSSIVLGCTHFNFFKDSFRKVLPKEVFFVDGIEGTVNQLIRKLKCYNDIKTGKQSVRFYISGEKVRNKEKLRYFENLLIRLDKMYKIS